MTGGEDSSFTTLLTTEILTGEGTFQPGPDMPAELYDHCQVQMRTSVYVIGGYGPNVDSSSVFVLQDLVWKEVSPLLTPRGQHACIAYGGKIYAIGGVGVSTVEIYDPLTDSWQALYMAQVINHQDNLYVLGGVLGSGQYNTEVFTMSGGEWQVVPGVTVEDPLRRVFPAPVLGREVLFCQ